MPFSILPTSAVERILTKLEGVKPAGEGKWMALCPAHDDKQRSLSIKVGTDGRAMMYCHASCKTQAIVAAIGLTMADLFPAPLNGQRPAQPAARPTAVAPAQGVETRRRLVATYDYTSADGVLLFQSCRYEPKGFNQRRRDGNNWIYNLGDVEPVLYRLPELIEAVAAERRIFVTEGEKDADTLIGLGYPATTNPMGAGKWREAYSPVLAKADVVIMEDNDEAGAKHVQQVAASLYTQGCTVRVLKLPNLPPKGDVSDWLAAGGDLDTLESLIGATPRWTPEGLEATRRTRWRLDELWENDSIMRPPPPIVPRLAWAGRSTLLAAREKSGKSTLIGYIAAMVSRGGPFLGDSCASGDVLIIGLEEFLGDVARRLRHFDAAATHIHLVDGFVGDPRERPRELADHIDAVDPVFVVIDSLAAYSHGQVADDNNASQMTSVVQPLTDLAHSRGVALVIAAHARKQDGRSRGSTAITAGVDVVVEFFCPDENTDPTLRRVRTAGRVPVQPFYDLRFDGDRYALVSSPDIPVEAQILSVVGDRPGCSINDVCQAVTARSETVRNAIARMLASRTILNLSDSTSRAKLALAERSGPGLAL